MKLVAAILFLLVPAIFFCGFIPAGDHSILSGDGPHRMQNKAKSKIITGADQTEKYFSYLKGKRVAVLANQTTIIGKRHLVDSLQSKGINIVKVFGPEHGFRGN
ncbi:MAG: exo-beta-N-acetylmuramidase NamZ domain-containing protein, partial [Bacteroidota bacterium]